MEIREKSPLVSVIMPAYNASAFIEEAVMSVVNQTMTNWELFIVDDCSKDDTLKVAKRIAETDPRINVIQNEVNMGVAKTRNRGLDLACGSYVALLDSDDYWYPCFLEKMVAHAVKTHSDIVYCSYQLVDSKNDKVCNDFIVPEATTFDESIVRSVISCSTVLLNFDIYSKYRFPVNMYHEDIALWFELLRDGKIARGVSDVLAAYRQSPNSRSSDKLKSAARRWTIYRKHLKMPLVKSALTMCRYAYYGLNKYRKI